MGGKMTEQGEQRRVRVSAQSIARLLHAIADRLKLIGEVLATGVGRIEVRLDHHGEATADHAIALTAAERRLHARRALVGHTLCEDAKGTVSIGMKRVQYAVMVQVSRLRTHQPHVETHFVPFDHRAGDLEVGKPNRSLPRLRRVENQVVERVTDLCTRKRNTRSAMRACVEKVQWLCALVFWPAYASGK